MATTIWIGLSARNIDENNTNKIIILRCNVNGN